MRGRIGAKDFRLGFAILAGVGAAAAAPEPYLPGRNDTGGDSRRLMVDSSSSARLMVIGQPDVQGGLRQDTSETYRVRVQ